MAVRRSTVLERMEEAGLRRPEILTLVLTDECNLACGHCWVEAPRPARGDMVPTGQLVRMLDEFAALGGREVNLTGGEPLLHPDWAEVTAHACSLPGLEIVCFQTNAALLTAADATRLAGVSGADLWVQVSLDGASAAAHDAVRGRGSFADTVRGLRRLVAAGLGGRTRIAFTEMRHSVDGLPDLFALAEELGVAEVRSASLVAHGRAAVNARLEPPRPEQYAGLLDRYEEDPEFKRRVDEMGDLIPLAWLRGRAYPRTEACVFGRHLYLSPAGMLYPCHLFPVPAYGVEDTYSGALEEALERGLSRWAEAQALSEARAAALAGCGDCAGREHCGGGCMGRAWVTHGGPYEVEDRCGLRRAVYAREERAE